MKIPIEPAGSGSGYTDWPAAEPGTYHMQIRGWDQDVKTRNGTKDVIEFVGEDGNQTVGSKLWLGGPAKKPDGKMTKGNLWMYRKVAEALGQEALAQYEKPMADGGSSFRPSDWVGFVKVTIGQYGVDSVEQPDVETIKRLAAPAATQTQTHTAVSDDEIPF